MNFPQAMDKIFTTHTIHVRRSSWPKELLVSTLRYDSPPVPHMIIYGDDLYGNGMISWCPSPEDLHATDWETS